MSSVFIDHHRWLVNSNLLTDEMKDNIAMCGFCLLDDVKNATTFIDFNKKIVTYHLLIPASLYENLKILHRFNSGQDLSFLEYWRLKRFLSQKNNKDSANTSSTFGDSAFNYRLTDMGNSLIKKYLNNEWSVNIKLFKEEQHERENFWLNMESNSEFNL